MSFTRIHTVEKTFEAERFWLGVYVDKSAALIVNTIDGQPVFSRCIDPDEDGADIAIGGEAKTWFDLELAAGRAKVGKDEGQS